MSIFSSKTIPSMTSGARYHRLCTYELRVSFSHMHAPKSIIFTVHREMEAKHTLSGFTSQWISLARCMSLRPVSNWKERKANRFGL